MVMAWLTKITVLFPLLFILSGCSPDKKNEQLAGNISGFNHVKDTSVNWFSVNGYYGRGAAGTCCIMIPSQWSPGQTVLVEWEVDPEPYAYAKGPPLGTDEFREFMKKHKANYRHYSKRVEVPQYDAPCGIQVHFLPCQEVKITLSCYALDHPNYPIKEPSYMEEPTECPVPVNY